MDLDKLERANTLAKGLLPKVKTVQKFQAKILKGKGGK